MLEFAEWLQTTPVSVTIQSVEWIIPLLQSIHILMIGVVFVSILMIALRVLGRVRMDEPFARGLEPVRAVDVERPRRDGAHRPHARRSASRSASSRALSFWLKMGLIAIGVVEHGRVRPLASAPAGARDRARPEFSRRDQSRDRRHARALARDHLSRPRHRLRHRSVGLAVAALTARHLRKDARGSRQHRSSHRRLRASPNGCAARSRRCRSSRRCTCSRPPRCSARFSSSTCGCSVSRIRADRSRVVEHELLRWTWAAFVVAVITGALMFAANATTYFVQHGVPIEDARAARRGHEHGRLPVRHVPFRRRLGQGRRRRRAPRASRVPRRS